jgi:hypothetical protein
MEEGVMSSLKLLLLGSPRLERDNVPVNLERRKAMALLAFLAVTGAPQSREALATLLWPNHDESQGHAYLRRALWTLKQALGAEQVAIGRERIALAGSSDPLSDVWLDVARVRRLLASCTTHSHAPNEVCPACLPLLAEAVALYRADFMAGFTLTAQSSTNGSSFRPRACAVTWPGPWSGWSLVTAARANLSRQSPTPAAGWRSTPCTSQPSAA